MGSAVSIRRSNVCFLSIYQLVYFPKISIVSFLKLAIVSFFLKRRQILLFSVHF